MLYPTNKKKESQLLRASGKSIDDIAKLLSIAKSTAYIWVRDVDLSIAAKNKLLNNSALGRARGRHLQAVHRDEAEAKRSQEAKKLVAAHLGTRNKDFWRLFAALIFWCEGSKRYLSTLQFTNSDPDLVSAFLTALRRGYNIDNGKLHALIHLHGYHNEKEQLQFWSRVTGIPISQFMRSYQKPNTGVRVRDGYQGCLSVRYNDASIARSLASIYHAVAQTMGAW
ncbi:MAG: hypothetical protein WC817_00055 [Patescibacteria group bacterium]